MKLFLPARFRATMSSSTSKPDSKAGFEQQDFSGAVFLDEANVGMKTVMPTHATMSLDKPRQVRVESNANVVKRLRPSDDETKDEVW